MKDQRKVLSIFKWAVLNALSWHLLMCGISAKDPGLMILPATVRPYNVLLAL